MMLDADVVAVSPSSVYRVLSNAGLMKEHNSKPSLKGKGFHQPLRTHEHWHVDVTYIKGGFPKSVTRRSLQTVLRIQVAPSVV